MPKQIIHIFSALQKRQIIFLILIPILIFAGIAYIFFTAESNEDAGLINKREFVIAAFIISCFILEFILITLPLIKMLRLSNDNLMQAEKNLKEERNLLKTIIDNIPVNVFVKDLQSRKTLVNRKEIEYMGFDNEAEVLGKNDYELYPAESAAISVAEDQEVIKSGHAFTNLETSNIKLDGVQNYFLTTKIPLKNQEDEVTGLLGLSFNITQRKKNEKKLRELLKVTGAQNTKLLNFAHIVSHNLRSHSTNFSMLLNFLETENCETEKQKMFDLLKRASSNLSETVEHLNEVVDINNLSEKTEPINLREAVVTVQNNVSALMLQQQVQCFNEIDPNISIHIVPAYLDSILLNFFTNAIKYKSAAATPFIKLSAVKENDYVVLAIEDNGLGIDLEKYGEKLFGIYNTFHGNKDAKGVGLFITKNQVEAMGGRIEVNSKPGEGTVFKVYFYEKS